jgi:hypothetical protein
LKEPRIYRKLRPVAGPTTLSAVAAAALALAAASVAAPPPPPGPATPATVGYQETLAEVARVVPAVAAARHLLFVGPLAVRPVGRDAMRGAVAAAIAAGAGGATTAAEEKILARLGLVPAGADLGQRLAERAATAAVPYYDPAARRLLIPDFVPLASQRLELPHEIAHAIADQRFGIRHLLEIGADGTHRLDGDAERARLAVVEGDAMLAGLELADPNEAFLGARELGALGAGLRDAAADPRAPWLGALGRFTHVDGLMFVARVRARRPWSAVDALWTDPPASTEQVLHPEKYEACEEPVRVGDDLFPELPSYGRPAATAVLGELVVRTWLAAALPPEIAERAAAGWGGDRAALYEASEAPPPGADGGADPTPPKPALAWLTVWDDGAEADDFARAAAAAVKPGAGAVLRRAEAVAIVLGPADVASTAASTLVDRWTRPQEVNRRGGARPRHAAPPGCPRRDRAAGPR